MGETGPAHINNHPTLPLVAQSRVPGPAAELRSHHEKQVRQVFARQLGEIGADVAQLALKCAFIRIRAALKL